MGMLKALAEQYPQVGETFAGADQELEYALSHLVCHGPAPELNQTVHTQPAMLSAGVAIWRCWQQSGGPVPDWMAGHSLGEYTALCCAGALSFAGALRLVQTRARLMQEAVPEGGGAMAALLGIDADRVQNLCSELAQGQVLEIANYNARSQIVIAGHREAVQRTMQMAGKAGARRCVLLPLSIPSHCSLMRPAAEKFAPFLREAALQPPQIPVLHNVDARVHPEREELLASLCAQLYRPVRWVDTVRALAQAGVETVLEFGPGRVLSGLCRRIETRLQALPVMDPASLLRALEVVRG